MVKRDVPMTEKILIFDASSLISFAMNGLLGYLEELKKIFPGKFIIPQEVKHEVIDRPLTIKRFELEAMQVNQLLLNKTIELPSAIGVSDKEISEETKKLLDIANNAFTEKNKPVHLIDLGETACVALAKILNKNSIPNLLVIDERTTRMLCEKPDNLRKLLTKKHHTTIKYDKNSLAEFTGFKIIRSAELAFLAHKKGIVKIKDKKVLDALIYALKFKGCSISTEEIEELKRMK